MIGNEIQRKLVLFMEGEKKIHIRCHSGRFYNGTILELNVKKQLVIITDVRIGEVPILFEEIYFVEPFKEVGE